MDVVKRRRKRKRRNTGECEDDPAATRPPEIQPENVEPLDDGQGSKKKKKKEKQ